MRRAVADELGVLASRETPIAIQTVLDRANRSQVSFYTVDPMGLTTGAIQAERSGASAASARRAGMALAVANGRPTRDYLQRLAADTGGRAFFDTNDLGLGLRAAWQDARGYYLIGYVPKSNRTKGRFRKVTVEVKRPDLDVRHRRGYYEWSAKELAEQDIERALRMPGAFVQPGVDVFTQLQDERLAIVVAVPPRYVQFNPTANGSKYRAAFSVHGELRDAKGDLVGGGPLVGRDVTLEGDDERVAAIRAATSLRVNLEATVRRPGNYTLSIAVRDGSGWMATAVTRVTK